MGIVITDVDGDKLMARSDNLGFGAYSCYVQIQPRFGNIRGVTLKRLDAIKLIDKLQKFVDATATNPLDTNENISSIT